MRYDGRDNTKKAVGFYFHCGPLQKNENESKNKLNMI